MARDQDDHPFLDYTPPRFEFLLSILRTFTTTPIYKWPSLLQDMTTTRILLPHQMEWEAMIDYLGIVASLEEAIASLKKASGYGSRLDAMDRDDKCYEAVVVDNKRLKGGEEAVKVHYMGWESEFDEVIPLYSDRLAKLPTHTRDWRAEVRIGSIVEVSSNRRSSEAVPQYSSGDGAGDSSSSGSSDKK